MVRKRKRKVVAISGGFDPMHIGHVRMIKEAAKYGKVVVILNSDVWLMKKKGYFFMSYEERKELLESMRHVYQVMPSNDDSDDACKELEKIKPKYFANGGGRNSVNTPEADLCKKLEIETLWDIGGAKIQSSSRLINDLKKRKIGKTDLVRFSDIINSFYGSENNKK